MRKRLVRAAGWFGLGAVTGFYVASRSIRSVYGPQLARLAELRERLEAVPDGPLPTAVIPVKRAVTREDLETIRDNLRKARGISGPTIDDLANRSRFDRNRRG